MRQSLAAMKVALAAALVLPACSSRVEERVFTEPVTARRYRVFVQRGDALRRPSPALFALHAYATDPEVLMRAYALQRRAVSRRGWILVLPEGTRDAHGQLSWNASAACCGSDLGGGDVFYLHRVLKDLRTRMAVDAERIYAIGVSNGAFMAHRWACDAAGDVRAIVSVSGAAPGSDDPLCAPPMPVSILQIHGDQDPVIRYEGGKRERGRYPSARESVETWRRLNSCGPNPRNARKWRLFAGSSRIEAWSCPQAPVVLWTIEGGSHDLRSLRFLADELLDFLADPRSSFPLGEG